MNQLSKTAKLSLTVGAFITTLVLATVLPLALKQENIPSSSNVQQQQEFDAKTTASDTQSIPDNLKTQLGSSNDEMYGESKPITSEKLNPALEPNCVCFTSEEIDETVSRLQKSSKNHVTFFSERSCTGTDRNGIYFSDYSYGYPAAYGMGVDVMNNGYTCVVADMIMDVTPEEGLECKRLIESKCAEHATALSIIQNGE